MPSNCTRRVLHVKRGKRSPTETCNGKASYTHGWLPYAQCSPGMPQRTWATMASTGCAGPRQAPGSPWMPRPSSISPGASLLKHRLLSEGTGIFYQVALSAVICCQSLLSHGPSLMALRSGTSSY